MKLFIMLSCGVIAAVMWFTESNTRMPDTPCVCTNSCIRSVITEEVIATEAVGKRYKVATHHYLPLYKDSNGETYRFEVMVGYPNQYLREDEPLDTSITNNGCFCGGPWEFTTNGLFECEHITTRTGMECSICGGYVWETNTYIRAIAEEGVEDGK